MKIVMLQVGTNYIKMFDNNVEKVFYVLIVYIL